MMPRLFFLSALVTALATTAIAEAQDDNATFEVVADISWNKKRTPFEIPANAHLTQWIGATHNTKYVLFRDGRTASSGLELIAENGRRKTLEAEFSEAVRRGRVGTVVTGPALPRIPGKIVTQFSTSKRHPLLSLVAMIAPSPDWFTGIADVSLIDNDEWKNEVTVVLWAWDAGTDSATTYVAKNMDTQPQESIRLLATRHFLTKEGLVPVGTIRLKRIRP